MRPDAFTTAWAVFMGCNTRRRLAAEMNISDSAAHTRLQRAMRTRLIKRDGVGQYGLARYRVCDGFRREEG